MAMDMARKGQADVLLVHDPAGEQQKINRIISALKLQANSDYCKNGKALPLYIVLTSEQRNCSR